MKQPLAVVFDETPEQAERAILRGLRYLEQEAHSAELAHLAIVIREALVDYFCDIKEEDLNKEI